ncbi:MAG: hypothetical protein AAF518_05215 [Spirochaetota bacterium]
MKNKICYTKRIIPVFTLVLVIAFTLTSCKRKKKSNQSTKFAFMGLIATSSQPGASPENTSQLCLDGIDNNGDGNIDCEDTSCQYFTFCSTASSNTYEYTSSQCQDNEDNDGNGLTDCEDSNCSGYTFCTSQVATSSSSGSSGSSSTSGSSGSSSSGSTSGSSGSSSSGSTSGSSGSSSSGSTSGSSGSGSSGSSSGSSGSSGSGSSSVENTASMCVDGVDNDSDGNVDCQDSECSAFLFCQSPTEDTAFKCQDGLDNDNDTKVDCQDSECSMFTFCANQSSPVHGFPLVDSWNETFDGLSRTADTWENANANCASLGGRLPTASELYRSNAITGTSDLGGLGETDYLWTTIASYETSPSEYFLSVRLSDGSVTHYPKAETHRYRCVWPDSSGSGFDSYRCNGPAGSTCFSDGIHNVDKVARPPMPYSAAVQECAMQGASVLSIADYGRVIRDGLPHNNDSTWQWAAKPAYHPSDYMMGLVVWDDTTQPFWTWQYSGMGTVTQGHSFQKFRCIGLADQSSVDVPASPQCHLGNCFQTNARRSPLVADGLDRNAATYADAFESCRALGAELPTMGEVHELIHAGWENGSNNWIWTTDTQYCNDYCQATARWSGTGTKRWYYYNGATAASQHYPYANTVRYRCVWRPKQQNALPNCADNEVIKLVSGSYQCITAADGNSNGNTNGAEFTDCFGNKWDAVERPAIDWATAKQTCENLGGRLPYPGEAHAIRNGTTINACSAIGDVNSTSYQWTLARYQSTDRRMLIRYSDNYTADTPESSTYNFRCMWPSSRGDVLSGPGCMGEPGSRCFTVGDEYIADAKDRAPVSFTSAQDECRALGGRLPDLREMTELTHNGWVNGSGNWLWMDEGIWWQTVSSGYSLAKWTGTADASWHYQSGALAWPYTSPAAGGTYIHFRCIFSTKKR